MLTPAMNIAAELVGGDRRTAKRFRISVPLSYAVLHNRKRVQEGSGSAVDISARGIHFVPDHPIAAGSEVEVTIRWPTYIENGATPTIVARGIVKRAGGKSVAVQASKVGFLRSRSGSPASTLPN